MNTIGLKKLEKINVDKMGGRCGIRLRKVLYPITKFFARCDVKLSSGKKIVVDNEPNIGENEECIFAASTDFAVGLESIIGSLDRNAYLLTHSKDRLEHDPKMYGAWLNGIVYGNRNDEVSMNDAKVKLTKVLKNGGSVILCPEGGWNNSINALCCEPYDEVFSLSTNCGKKIVPVSAIYSEKDDMIHVRYGEPIDLSLYRITNLDTKDMKRVKKGAGNRIIKDSIASLAYDLIEDHTIPYRREDIVVDNPNKMHADERVREYMLHSWTDGEALKREINERKPSYIVNPEDVEKRIRRQTTYEDLLGKTLLGYVNDYIISMVEAYQLLDKLRRAKSPGEALFLLRELGKTYGDLDVYDRIDNLELGDKESFLEDYEPKEIVYSDEVWNFLDNVQITYANAPVIVDAIVDKEKKEQETRDRDLGLFVDNNFNIINLEKKNKKVKSLAR